MGSKTKVEIKKMKTRLHHFSIGFFLALMVLVFDQWSKIEILNQPQLIERETIEVTSFFNLVLVLNRGISFGMFSEQNQPLLLSALSLIIIFILLMWLWRSPSVMLSVGIGCIIGGAIGNIIDRLRYGGVVDFLDFHIGNLHWPAFNIADSFIFIGVVVLCIYSMFFEEKNQL